MKILIVKTSSLGDIIHCFPVVSFLKNKFPYAEIDWIVEAPFSDLVTSHPAINRVHVIDTKKWRRKPWSPSIWNECKNFKKALPSYDILFDLQGNTKSAVVTWLVDSPRKVGFGQKTVAERANCWVTNEQYDPPLGHNIREDYLYILRSAFDDFDTKASQQVVLRGECSSISKTQPVYLICPGSNWINKQVHPVALRRFLSKLQNEKGVYYLFSWGTSAEKNFAEELADEFDGEVTEKLRVPDLQALMRQVDCVIAMDSLPLHLAGTTDTPTFSIFGPSSADKYRPIGAQHVAIQGECPYGKTFEKRCPILRSCPTGACIREIDGEMLYTSFVEEMSSTCSS